MDVCASGFAVNKMTKFSLHFLHGFPGIKVKSKLKSGSCHAPVTDADLPRGGGGGGGERPPDPFPGSATGYSCLKCTAVRSVKDKLFRRPAVGNQNRIR